MTIRAFCADQLFTWHELVHNGCIVYKDNRIVDVGKKGSIDVPVDLFELKGYTLLPGLIDAHIHITGFRSGDYIKESLLVPYSTFVARAIKDLESVLMAGYTTIVDAGSTISLELKKSAEEGVIKSPRIVASGYPFPRPSATETYTFYHRNTSTQGQASYACPYRASSATEQMNLGKPPDTL